MGMFTSPRLYWWGERGYNHMVSELLDQMPLSTDTWQGMDISKSKVHGMHELEDVTLCVEDVVSDDFPSYMAPDMPWAEEHFMERVSGVPYNPAPSAARWPHAVRANADHTTATKYDHTYPERFWPVAANMPCATRQGWVCEHEHERQGIRFAYGDLSDVIELLVRDRHSRQAYLPVWFPEDTGARRDGKNIRVPCTLGYHFMVRDGRLSCRYYIRSCDVYRHLNNDVYMAARLMQWVVDSVNHYTDLEYDEDYAEVNGKLCPAPIAAGRLVMHVASLHTFLADVPKLKQRML